MQKNNGRRKAILTDPLHISPTASIPQTARLDRLRTLAGLLDTRFRIPGVGWRFGLDGLVGLIPGIGDTAMAAVSCWFLLEGYRMGARKRVLSQMAGNIAIDYVLGLVPLAGDIFDVAFKANRRNVALLLKELENRA